MPRPKLPLLVFTLLLTTAASAQSPACQAPVLKPLAPGTSLFNDKQELKLANILHRRAEQELKMMDEPSLTGELQRVGERIAGSFPNTGVQFHYYVIDLPEANAFSQPGGNIYFSRKLIAFFHTEDELAGVMAHEMGHIVTHQGVIAISREMREVLGVKELGDDDDVEEKYNQLLDSYGKKPGAFHHNQSESHEQIDADQVAVFALGAAGYDVKTLPAFWDRFSENRGKKGNFFSDMFGATTEEQRRFRDMLKNAAAVAPECVGKHPQVSQEDFKRWQSAVLTYSGIGHPEKLDALIERKALIPPLRSELTRLRISPDGKYVLVQDPASIAVLNRADLKPLFRIDADEARSVQFSEDSKLVTFYSMLLGASPRIEVWSIADKSLRNVYEVRVPKGCVEATLSPNGKYFACAMISGARFEGGVNFDLRIYNVETGEPTLTKKDFFTAYPEMARRFLLEILAYGEETELYLGALHFTPDSKYLLFGCEDSQLAFESENGNKLSLPGSIKSIMRDDFTFLDGGRMAGQGGDKGDRGAVVKFPSGEVIYSNLNMGITFVEGAAHGDYVTVSPVNEFASAILDLKQNKYLVGTKKGVLDIYDTQFIREKISGQLTMSDIVSHQDLGSVDLAEGPLGRVVAADASDDLNYIAISGTIRGAVWNVKQGTRVAHLRRFDAVGVDDSGFMVADFPEEGKSKRQFAQVDTVSNAANSFDAESGVFAREAGPYLVTRIPPAKDVWNRDVTCQVKSIRDNKILWERKFPSGINRAFAAPANDSLVFVYDVEDDDGKVALDKNIELRNKVQALKTREHAYAIEALELKTGKPVGMTAIDTGKGSFRLRNAFTAGRSLVISDTSDRVQVFGFDGVRIGRLQAHDAIVTRDGRLLAANQGRGRIAIYDLEKFRLLDLLEFNSLVATAKFSTAGDRLLVVTRDQKAYYFDTKALHRAEQVAATTH